MYNKRRENHFYLCNIQFRVDSGKARGPPWHEKDKNNHRENLAYEAILILVVKEDFHNFNLLLIL